MFQCITDTEGNVFLEWVFFGKKCSLLCWRMAFALGFSEMAFLRWSSFLLLSTFIMKKCQHLLYTFYVLIETIMYSSPSLIVGCYICFLKMHIDSFFCSGINLAIIWCNRMLNVLLNSVCWDFLDDFYFSIYERYCSVVFSSCSVFIWLCYQVTLTL